MGAWGTGISSSDTYADVYGEFFTLFDQGKDVGEITAFIKRQFAATIEDPQDNHDFWFALAKAQWECKELDQQVLRIVEEIIEDGSNIRLWNELGASKADLRKRQAVLEKFLGQLKSHRERSRKRKKKVIRDPVFEKGECLTFRLANGNYGGAVVLESIWGTEYNYSLIALTRINQRSKPTTADLYRSDLLLATFANFKESPALMWYLPFRHKNVANLIEVIGRLDVQVDYPLDGSTLGHMGDFDGWVIEHAGRQFEYELSNPRSDKQISIKSLVNGSWWNKLTKKK